ncbi:hypothetical protein [Aidingimonas halophila]|uniref:Uncharacterized protein n=1 Tax=Aidingimonas halophila TaxID=574349 RepID=A0A1H2RJB3_9GAMM|nr:hypothetical protein [Aidingimonas halophila]GHC19217.1 hypothetical protein GCM10008094_06470 [Aidingimonas halophila]SDW18864.1 hypothetical protein SAMN05443545_101325 [Aidingimonas halophila]
MKLMPHERGEPSPEPKQEPRQAKSKRKAPQPAQERDPIESLMISDDARRALRSLINADTHDERVTVLLNYSTRAGAEAMLDLVATYVAVSKHWADRRGAA